MLDQLRTHRDELLGVLSVLCHDPLIDFRARGGKESEHKVSCHLSTARHLPS